MSFPVFLILLRKQNMTRPERDMQLQVMLDELVVFEDTGEPLPVAQAFGSSAQRQRPNAVVGIAERAVFVGEVAQVSSSRTESQNWWTR